MWGICDAPPARARSDPMPANWTHHHGGGMTVAEDAPILSGGLPAENDAAWRMAEIRLARAFAEKEGWRLKEKVRAAELRFAHPRNDAQVDALRAVYNGDVTEPEGGCLPRVWQWEHEEQTWWLVELPPHLEWAWRSLL